MTLRALPKNIQNQVVKSGKTLDQFSLEALQDFIEICLEEYKPDKLQATSRDVGKNKDLLRQRYIFNKLFMIVFSL